MLHFQLAFKWWTVIIHFFNLQNYKKLFIRLKLNKPCMLNVKSHHPCNWWGLCENTDNCNSPHLKWLEFNLSDRHGFLWNSIGADNRGQTGQKISKVLTTLGFSHPRAIYLSESSPSNTTAHKDRPSTESSDQERVKKPACRWVFLIQSPAQHFWITVGERQSIRAAVGPSGSHCIYSTQTMTLGASGSLLSDRLCG